MIEIKRMQDRHIAAMAKLERVCFSDPWSEDSFAGELDNPLACYFVAEEEGRLLGYAGLWGISGEGNITNIAVEPEYRRKKVGSSLLSALIGYAREHRFKFLTLEARISNEPAKRLYKAFGFRPVGIRKGYYQGNREDAVLMTLELEEREKQDETAGN